MAITGVNHYTNRYLEYSNSEKNAQTKAENTDRTEKSDVESNFKNQDVSDYYSYLQKNYSAMKSGNVSIAGEYIKQCASNRQKAKELEGFLEKIPELEEQGYQELAARNKALGGTVTYYQQSWTINKDGSVQSTVYSVTETGMTNAERMKKNMDERLEKQKEKRAEEKREEEKAEEEKTQELKPEENGLETLKDNKLYQSLEVKHMDAPSWEALKVKISEEKAKGGETV